MPTVYQYEVEARVTHKRTGQARLVTRTEHAYGVMDALAQASMHLALELKDGEEVERFTHVGPPAELVRAATTEMMKMITDDLERIKKVK